MKFQLKIIHKLFLPLLILSGTALVLMVLLMRWSLGRGFLDYLNRVESERRDTLILRLQESYRDWGSWEPIRYDRELWRRFLENDYRDGAWRPPRPRMEERRPPHLRGEGPRPGPRRKRNPPEHRIRITLYDAQKKAVIGPDPPHNKQVLTPIVVNRELVGHLGVVPLKEVTESRDIGFLKQQSRALLVFAGVLLVLAALVAVMLARYVSKPLKALAKASHKLTEGAFDTRVPVDSGDEIGDLARDFNHLAHTLQQNEEARQRWVAEISHELRTPLAVLRGEVEAVQDGVRPLGPKTLRSLHSEIMCLSKIVDDLYELSLADIGALNYRVVMLNPFEVLERALGGFSGRLSQKGLSLESELPEDTGLRMFGDPDRLFQLFSNLLENSCRYTDSGGKIKVSGRFLSNRVAFRLEDSLPGVAEKDLNRLFDRLYRVESSRNRLHGGAGLGLAICQNIVEAHGGEIRAEQSSLGGLAVEIVFPLSG